MAKISREAGPSDVAAADVIHGDGTGAALPEFDGETEREAGDNLEEFAETHGNTTTNEIEAEKIVASGTVADVLAWVGSDLDRAVAALDAENAKETPRVGVTGPLTTIVDNATAGDGEEGTGEVL